MSQRDNNIYIVTKNVGIGDIVMLGQAMEKVAWPVFFELAIVLDTTQKALVESVELFTPANKLININEFVDKDNRTLRLDKKSLSIERHLSHVSRTHLYRNILNTFLRDYQWTTTKRNKPINTDSIQKDIDEYRNQYKRIISLHVDTAEEKRSWPIEHNIRLVEMLNKTHPDTLMLVFDHKQKYSDWNKFDNVIDCSNTSVLQMAQLIKESDLFIGPDSGPMHIAGYVGTESLVLFGPTPSTARLDGYSKHEPVQRNELECSPCWYKECTCNNKCLTSIKPEYLYFKTLSKLKLGVE